MNPGKKKLFCNWQKWKRKKSSQICPDVQAVRDYGKREFKCCLKNRSFLLFLGRRPRNYCFGNFIAEKISDANLKSRSRKIRKKNYRSPPLSRTFSFGAKKNDWCRCNLIRGGNNLLIIMMYTILFKSFHFKKFPFLAFFV